MDRTYGDRVMTLSMEQASNGFDPATAKRILRSGLVGLERQVAELEVANYKDMKPEVLGRLAAFQTKFLDELSRLMEFLEGRADSRAEVSIQAGQLERLSDSELRELEVKLGLGAQRLLEKAETGQGAEGASEGAAEESDNAE